MGTGKRRINSGVRALVALAELELVRVVAELEHDPVAAELELVRVVAELEHDPVVAELELVPVVVELEHVPVAADLEHVPVAVEQARDHRHAQLAVAPKIKSVTAAHHRGLPLLAVADLAAAAETTREPAAIEAVVAWEVAGTAAAVGGIAVAAVE